MGKIIIEKKVYRFTYEGVGKRIGAHPLTISRILNQGETHPRYAQVLTTIINMNKEGRRV